MKAAARDLSLKWLEDRKSLPRGLVAPVLLSAAADGDCKLYDQFRAAALASKDQQEQQALIRAMSSFRNPEIVKIGLDEVLKSDFDMRVSLNLLFGPTTNPGTRDMPF